MCRHAPPCPTADAPDRKTARTISRRPSQGWSVTCSVVTGGAE
ncbi:DUF5999 family protein [Streptomyces sp. NPDC023723]